MKRNSQANSVKHSLYNHIRQPYCYKHLCTDDIDALQCPLHGYYTLSNDKLSQEKKNSVNLGYAIFVEEQPHLTFELISTVLEKKDNYTYCNVIRLNRKELEFLISKEATKGNCSYGNINAFYRKDRTEGLYVSSKSCIPSYASNKCIKNYNKEICLTKSEYEKLMYYSNMILQDVDAMSKYIKCIPWAEACVNVDDRAFLKHLITNIASEIFNQGNNNTNDCNIKGLTTEEKMITAFDMINPKVVNRILMMQRYMAPEDLLQDILDQDKEEIITDMNQNYISPVSNWFMYHRRMFMDTCSFFCQD